MELEDYIDDGKVHKSWVFTLNNYTEAECNQIKSLEGVTRLIVGKEVAASGTPHLQGMMIWKSGKRWAAMKKLFPRMSFRKMKSEADAANYCRKEHNMLCDIDNRCQGARNDLRGVVDMIHEGKSVYEIGIETANYQATRMAELLLRNKPTTSEWLGRRVLWFWGPTDTYKSRTARKLFPGLYWKKSYKWWNNYQRQDVVLIDDIRADYCKFHELLTLLDGYAYTGETKGGYVDVVAKTIVVTSCYHPADLYRGRTDEDIQQLVRRCTQICHFHCRMDVTVTEVGEVILSPTPVSKLTSAPPSGGALEPKPAALPAAARALASAYSRYSHYTEEE